MKKILTGLSIIALAALTGCGGNVLASSKGSETQNVKVYYLADQGNEYRLAGEVWPLTGNDKVKAAVETMVKHGSDPDHESLWPLDAKVNKVTTHDGVATVDFAPGVEIASGSTDLACLTLQQLVWTVKSADPDVEKVAISIDGSTTDVLTKWWGAGCVTTNDPMAAKAANEVLAPIEILTPSETSTLDPAGITFSGEASVYEGNVTWRVLTEDLTVLAEGTVQASEGAPGRGTWEVNVPQDDAIQGLVILEALSINEETGEPASYDTRTVYVGNQPSEG